MKFTLENAQTFGWEGVVGRAYNAHTDFENASMAYLEVTKSTGKLKSVSSDRIYYIIDGAADFVIGDKLERTEKTDVIVVPRDTEYYYEPVGDMVKFLEVQTPSYIPEDDVKI